MQRFIYSVLILAGVVSFEFVFMAVSSGYMQVHFTSPVLGNVHFFVLLLQDAPLLTLKMLLLEQPLLVVEARHPVTAATVWSLHYFSLTVVVHVVVSVILSGRIVRAGGTLRWQDIPFSGSVLLLFSSVYLLLSSCCTGGPNWIFHTWLLSVVFNPITSSNATIQLYQSLKDWFSVLQMMTGILGAYLMFRSRVKDSNSNLSFR